MIEFYFNGLGETNYPQAISNPDIVKRLARGELFVLDTYYLSGQIQAELHPLLNIYLLSINNITDPSGIIQPWVVWDFKQNLQLTAGVSIAWGKDGTEFGGFRIPGTNLLSKSADRVFAFITYYF
jgi:hypothetical protein